jgi:hypothetical protein
MIPKKSFIDWHFISIRVLPGNRFNNGPQRFTDFRKGLRSNGLSFCEDGASSKLISGV